MAVSRENQRDRRKTRKFLSQKAGGDDFKEKGLRTHYEMKSV